MHQGSNYFNFCCEYILVLLLRCLVRYDIIGE